MMISPRTDNCWHHSMWQTNHPETASLSFRAFNERPIEDLNEWTQVSKFKRYAQQPMSFNFAHEKIEYLQIRQSRDSFFR